MKKAVLLLFTLIILAGLGAGGYYYFKHPAEAAIGENAKHTKAAEVEKPDLHSASKHTFIELDPLILPIVDNNGVSQVISMVVVIEVSGDRNATKVENMEPRLKDAYIQQLYGVLNGPMAMKGGVLQVSVLKRKLNGITHKVMGEGVVEDVLLQVVQQRPL